MTKVLTLVLLFFGLFVCSAPVLHAQTTELAYQGNLKDGANPANGNYDFEFRLYNSLAGGTQIGPLNALNGIAVTNGSFSANLSFGSGTGGFPGSDRFLEIRVRPVGGPTFTTLSPRQKVLSSPYSMKTLVADTSIDAVNATNATTATNSTQLGGVAANQYVVTTDPRMTDARNPLPNSASYIQNTTSPQTTSNFNISGAGTLGGALTANSASITNTASANIFNAATQFNLGASRFFSNPGTQNTFAGINTGISNTGADNSFFGFNAGNDNTSGTDNTFIGSDAGGVNTSGANNSFFGSDTGDLNTTGSNNSFFGRNAGGANTIGTLNSFFGLNSGNGNTSGFNNAFFGGNAGTVNTTGDDNAFFGTFAGFLNFTGSNNTLIGAEANVAADPLTFATAIGSGAMVTSSNRVQLGRDGLDTVQIGLFANASATNLCRVGGLLALCSSSIRYKENVLPLASGLDLVRRLHPVTFDWKERKEADLGLIAEEVAGIEPLLVTHNLKGEIEGVKYDQLTVVLINAVKEQQSQIEAQQKEISELKKIVCSLKPDAEVCKE